MSERVIVIVEPESAFAEQALTALRRLPGVKAERAADGNELLMRREAPALIVLCIDPPLPTGWALCSKVKKSGLLKSVPLIVTSAQASEADFEAHKKFQIRAEEYLRKPYTLDTLITRVRGLLGAGAAGGDDEIELSIEDDDAPATIVKGDSQVPQIDEDEADAMLASISESVAAPPRPSEKAGKPTNTPPAVPSAVTVPRSIAPPPVSAIPLPAPQVVTAPIVSPASSPTFTVGAPAEIARLQEENARLSRELDDARAQAARPVPVATIGSGKAQSGGISRESIQLKEILNQKERELLDMQQQLDARDRLVLDGKDKLREAERARRDLEDGKLSLEKDLIGATEQLETLAQTHEELARARDEALERERGLKTFIADAQRQLERARSESEQWKARHDEALAAASTASTGKDDLARHHAEERAALEATHAEALAALEDQLAEKAQEAEDLSSLLASARNDVDAANQQLAAANDKLAAASKSSDEQRAKDASAIERARKALTIALTLVDELKPRA